MSVYLFFFTLQVDPIKVQLLARFKIDTLMYNKQRDKVNTDLT